MVHEKRFNAVWAIYKSEDHDPSNRNGWGTVADIKQKFVRAARSPANIIPHNK